MFFKIVVFKNFAIFTGVLESLFNKVAGLKVSSFIEKKPQYKCFSVNIAKFLKTAFFHKTSVVVASLTTRDIKFSLN